jgi:hypothetical protein
VQQASVRPKAVWPAPARQEGLHPHLRLPDERVRLDSDKMADVLRAADGYEPTDNPERPT